MYGILGLAIFARALKNATGGAPVMSAGITLAILVLPIVIITSAEAIRAVPDSIREAGFGVGATRWEVIRSHVVPYAFAGHPDRHRAVARRALGEAAPLIVIGAKTGFFTAATSATSRAGSSAAVADLPVRQAAREQVGRVTAAAILVLLIVLLINTVAILLRNRFEKKVNDDVPPDETAPTVDLTVKRPPRTAPPVVEHAAPTSTSRSCSRSPDSGCTTQISRRCATST